MKQDQIRSTPERAKPSLQTAIILLILPGMLALLMFVVIPYLQGIRRQQKTNWQMTQNAALNAAQTATFLSATPLTTLTSKPNSPTMQAASVTPDDLPAQVETNSPTPELPGFCSPIEGVQIDELDQIISQEFSVPNQKSDVGHHGVDLGSYNFQGRYLYEIPVRAILSGRVAGITVNRPPIGNVVILETPYEDLPSFLQTLLQIQPGQSLYHFYGHLINEPVQQIGDLMKCGDQINLLGKSQTVEAHLHLETRIGVSGLVIDQMAFYDAATTEEERAEYLWWRTSGELVAVNPMDLFHAFVENRP